MKLLALDISSTNIGYVVWDGDAATLTGTLALKGDLLARIVAAQPRVEALVEQVQPDAVAYEGPAHRAHALSMIAQQRMVGIVLLIAGMRRLPLIEIAPAAAKKALSGNGNANKQMMELCAGAYLTGHDEHQADALGVALAAWPTFRQQQADQQRTMKRRAA
jgi:crossover junction endodeoxyribonuclease RuvC